MKALIMRLIEKGITDGLAEKVSKLYLFGQLTNAEYDEIMTLLNVE